MLSELAEAVRARRVSARELVQMSLERVGLHNPALNAVVALRADEAMAEAAALDERIARGDDVGLLAGVPFLVKDIEDLAGMPTTHGSLLFKDAPPAARDGLIAYRLRSAGAIPVGKTNTPEFAAEGYTANHLFGVTRNPWAREWSPGGSSGGSGAAIAAGMAPIATATDTGGSIRIPAAFCGLAGIKPTNGVIGRDLRLCWPDLTTCGPLATSIADLRLLLSVEAGAVAGDPTALPEWKPRPGRLPRLVLAAARFTPWGPLPEAVQELFDAALRSLAGDLGLAVDPLEPQAIFRSGNPDQDWFVLTGPELVEWLGRNRVARSMDLFHPAARGFLEYGLRVTMDDYLAARRRRFEYVRELDELLRDDAVIVTPTLASVGWRAEGPVPGSDAPGPPPEVYNCAVQNITGHPAITVPAGRLVSGVPFGLQFTGPRFRDDLLLDLGAAWEAAHPWSKSAPGYEPFEV